MNELFYKLLILRTPGIGPVKYSDLIARFGSARAAADSMQITDDFRDSLMREMERATTLGIEYISDDDARYPNALRAIKNHPPVLTARGNLATLVKPMISIVGTRHATGAGMRFTSELALAFAKNNFAVVSGMAMGTDTAAHLGALNADGNAQTVAVLAGGVDYIWPLENEQLYNKIIERGCVISEMPVGMVPIANNFIQRNRHVAGLCDKLILGEADIKSGSMTTARFAIDYKKQVFAIPSHPSDARSDGPNSLIKQGLATLCSGADDFFGAPVSKKQVVKNPENELIDRLGIVPLSESVLADLVKKSVMEIKRDLVVLELQGLVVKCDGGYVKV